MPWITDDGECLASPLTRKPVTWISEPGEKIPIIDAGGIKRVASMGTVDVKLHSSDFEEVVKAFRELIEENMEFIHSELESVEKKYSDQRQFSANLNTSFEEMAQNMKFFLERIEAKIDAEVYQRTQLSIRMQERLNFLESQQEQMKTFASQMYNDIAKLEGVK
jgi:lipopolysaccharide biosynthesis regulator YciM